MIDKLLSFEAPVLMLHRVLSEYDPENYYFQRQTAISRMRFTSLVHWAEEQRAQGLPVPVFTFDDGYADNQLAFRTLLDKQLPVVLFPVRDFVRTGFSPIDDMAARLNQGGLPSSQKIKDSLISGKLKACLANLSADEYRDYRTRWFGITDDSEVAVFMTETELADWVRQGLLLGVHGVSHRIWTSLTAQDLRMEIKASIDWLASLGCNQPIAFCMPHGKLDDRVFSLLGAGRTPLVGVDRYYKQPVIRRWWIKEEQP